MPLLTAEDQDLIAVVKEHLRTFTGAGGVITAGRGLPTGSIVYNSPVFKITGIVGKPKKLAVLFYFYGN